MHIQPVFLNVGQLLAGRLFRIPQYQRAYAWSTKQRRDLFDDIEKVSASRTDGAHFMATMVGLRRGKTRVGVDDFVELEIVDGQQRLTTLVILLKTVAIALSGSAAKKDQEHGQEIERLLVKGDDLSLLLLQTNHDLTHVFLNYIRSGQAPGDVIAGTTADQNLIDAILECSAFVSKWTGSGRSLVDLLALVRNRLSLIFHEIEDEALVYTVFEVLNSRGLDVTHFDKLKSFLMAIVFEHGDKGSRAEIINELHNLWRDIYRTVGRRQSLNRETVQFAGSLKATVQPNRPLSEEAAVAELTKQCGKSAKKAVDYTKWILKVVEAEDRLLSNNRLRAAAQIVQARLVAIAIYLRGFAKAEEDQLLKRWESVTFRMYGLMAYDSRTAVGEYVRLAWKINNERLSSQQIMSLLSDIGKAAPIKEAVKGLWNADCYNGWTEALRYFLYRYEEHLAKAKGQRINDSQWNKIWLQEPSKSIEHIKPQSTKVGYLHRLGNLTALPPGVNSSLKDKDPRSKRDTYKTCGLLGTAEVAEAIGKEKWSISGVEKREKKLMKWALKEWAD